MIPAGAAFIREALERHGLRPSRFRGQRFLVDGNLAAAIVRDAALGPGENVLEVGAGTGCLTARLAEPGRKVLAVEIEPALASVCREAVAGASDVEILAADALAGKRRLNPALERRLSSLSPFVLVSNLPYSIAGPLLVELGRSANPPARMVAMVQEEIALRIVAPPGSREYGPLSAALGIGWSSRILRRVPPEVFWPRPKVRSAILRLVPLDSRPSPPAYAAYLDGIRLLFRFPRKTLRAVVRGLGSSDPPGVLSLAGVDAGARVGELAPADLRRLADSLREADLPRPRAGGEAPG